tara:strand:- start:11178 stop:11705 length:528 start_codon:yes stop_codon:yes gene_type:complete
MGFTSGVDLARRVSLRQLPGRLRSVAPSAILVPTREVSMGNTISGRLLAIVDALPLAPGMRVLEIGCGPGVMAREMARRMGTGKVVAIDRSTRAIALARTGSVQEMAAGLLEFRQIAIEDLTLGPGDAPFDLAVAVRVGALDGRHPETGLKAHAVLAKVLKPDGQLWVDGRPVSL